MSVQWAPVHGNGIGAFSPDSGCKRGLDGAEDVPAKRLKQYLHEGYVRYGPEWANEAFLCGLNGGDIYMGELPATQAPEASAEKASMEVVEEVERDWLAWWNDRCKMLRS